MSTAPFAQEKTTVILGTATPGGGFPVYGDAVVAIVNAADASLALQPKNTKGSTENVPMLEVGQLDIALVQGEVVHEALSGIGRPPTKLRIIAAMYSAPG
ncbi:MAG TPA: TAXI family TRAP transporter solute-binding subunit, partial [Burkholderiales bacterium]